MPRPHPEWQETTPHPERPQLLPLSERIAASQRIDVALMLLTTVFVSALLLRAFAS